MKIIAKATQDFLKNPTKDVLGVLIFGADEGLALNHSRHIIHHILGKNYAPTALLELDDAGIKSDPARLADELGAMNMFGDKRMIWLRGVTEKSTDAIERAAEYFSKDCFLLATAGDLPARNKLRNLFEARKDLAALACYRLEGPALAAYIRGLIEAEGFQVDRQVVDTLARELGNDQRVTASEIEKLSLYALGQPRISMNDVEATILHNDQHQVDQLNIFYADRNMPAFDTLWHYLIQDGEQPIMLIRSLMRYISKLSEFKLQMKEMGLSPEAVIVQARPAIFWKQQEPMKRQLARLRLGDLLLMLHRLNQAEAAFKSSSIPPAMMASYVIENRLAR